MIFLSTLLFSVFITIALIPLLSTLAIRYRFVDMPGERKVHETPIPRIGGIAMAVGALLPMLYWQHDDPFVCAWLGGAAILVAFGIADDLRGLGPKTKLVGQIIAALVVIIFGGVQIRTLGTLLPDGMLLPAVIAIPLTLLAIVGVTNAVNLADGLDGLAGGISLLIFCSIGLLAYQSEMTAIGFASLALGGAIFGFLKFNTYPASVFMGDTGSQLLGFSAATLSLSLTQANTPLSPLLPLLLMGLPVLDTIYVMTSRLARGVSPFVADRNHLHHRLLNLGLRHTESVLVLYLAQTALITAAYFFRFYPDPLLLIGYLLFSALTIGISSCSDSRSWRMKRSGWFDTVLNRALKQLRDEGIIIKYTFRVFDTAMPLLFLFACIMPATVPRYSAAMSLVSAAAVTAIWIFRKKWLESLISVILYLMIPFVVYLGETNPAAWISAPAKQTGNLLYGVFTFFIIIISKFSRRKKGFKSTPMDFLIMFLAMVFPNLPGQYGHDYMLGLIASKIIVFYYCYEVLLAELRETLGKLALSTIAALLVFAIKGLMF